jgi:hypothetical protein
MPVRRTYQCDVCEYEFDHFHASSSEPYPECPACDGKVAWQPGSFAITGVKSKAVDATYKILEDQAGITDLSDNNRAGDVVAKAPPPIQQSESDVITRELVGLESAVLKQQAEEARSRLSVGPAKGYKGFFNNELTQPGGPVAQVAAAGAASARQSGVDPIGMLHASGKKGELPGTKVISRTDMSGNITKPVRL